LEDNYFTWQAFGRRYDHEHRKALPDYLKEENYHTLRDMVDRVETHVASLGDYLKNAEPNSLNGFILLDSQDWMPPEVIDELWSLIAKVGADDTRVIFRTAGEKSPVDEAFSPATAAQFRCNTEESRRLHEKDRSAIYGMFHIYNKVAATENQ
jgi:S-adenosylmethionine-diacylglycerol 3-amino-3-carboxypropyl transferase